MKIKKTVLTRTKEKRKKNFLVSSSLTLALLGSGGIAASALMLRPSISDGNAPILPENPTPPPPPTPIKKEILLTKSLVDKFTSESIQENLIKSKKLEQHQFKNELDKYVNESINSSVKFDISFPFNQKNKTYLKISITDNEQKNYKFKFGNDIPNDGKFILDKNETSLLVLMSEANNFDFKYFSTYKITNIDEGINVLKEEIAKENQWYTAKDFQQNFPEIIKKFYDVLKINDNKFEQSWANASFDINNEEIIINLNTDYKKYNAQYSSDNVLFDANSSTITIKKLSFYSEITISPSNDIFQNVQDFIENSKCTSKEFESETNNLKQTVANAIPNISESNIDLIEMDSTGNLIVSFAKQENTKYKIGNLPTNVTSTTTSINGELTPKIKISGLTYFKKYTISNLNAAYQAINQKIDQKRYSALSFATDIDLPAESSLDTFYETIKLNDGVQDVDFKQVVSTARFDTNTNNAIVELNTKFKKYVNVDESNINLTDSSITISKLDFYVSTTLTIQSDLKDVIQAFIDSAQQLTFDESKQEDKQLLIKEEIAKNITNLNENLIEQLTIEKVQEVNQEINQLSFVCKLPGLTPREEYEIAGNQENITIEQCNTLNGKLSYKVTIKGLEFFTKYEINDAQEAFNEITKEIKNDDNRYTDVQFEEKFADEKTKAEIMNKVYGALKFGSDPFDTVNVTSQFIKNKHEIEIKLDTNRKKYELLNPTDNFSLNEDKTSLLFKDIKFFETINISVNQDFKNNIQSFIKEPARRYTSDQFASAITDAENVNELKSIFASGLGLQQEDFTNIRFDNNELIIELKDNEYKKYTIENNGSDIELLPITANNSVAQIKVLNLDFFTEQNVTGTDTAYNALATKIGEWENRYTQQEFEQNIDTCLETFYTSLSGFNKDNIFDKAFANDVITIRLKKDNLIKYNIPNFDTKVTFDATAEYQTITISQLPFFTATPITIADNLQEDLQNFIKEPNRQYTLEQFLNASNDVKQRVAQHINGLEASQIANVGMSNKDLILTLNLVDTANTKYTFNNVDNVTVRYNAQKQYEIVISDLNFYKPSTIIPPEQIEGLWNKVNEYIKNADVRVTNDNISNSYENKKGEIFKIIESTPVSGGGTLKDFIKNPNSDITRNLANINIKLDETQFGELIKGQNLCKNQGYIEFNWNSKILSLNQLALGNPNDFFNWSGNTINGLSSKGNSYQEILIPKNCTYLGSNAFLNNNTIHKLVMNDTVTGNGHEAMKGMKQINFLKISRGIKSLTGNFIFECVRLETVLMHNGITSVDQNSLKSLAIRGNMDNRNNFVMPPSLRSIHNFGMAIGGAGNTYNIDVLNELTMWACELDNEDFSARHKLTRVNLLTENPNDLRHFHTWGGNKTFESNTRLYVKNDAIAQRARSVYSLNHTPTVDNSLYSKYPKDKYCPVHGIDK